MQLPLLVANISKTWPETLGSGRQNSVRTVDHPSPLGSLAVMVAHSMAGGHLNVDRAAAAQEIADYLKSVNVPVARLAKWAKSLLIPHTETAPESACPTYNKAFKFTLHPYQHDNARWAAHRMGSLLAFGCGVGKTATAVSAALGAVALGNASAARCLIIAPVNAMGVWERAKPDLLDVFQQVIVYSGDSVHHLTNLDPGPGGVIIIDEAHRAKGSEARRSKALLQVRGCFDWGIALSGSMLESGPEGLIQLHEAACPGLARYSSAMLFGENFDCIARKRIGRQIRRKLVIPSEAGQALMVPYMARSTRSLSFTSPEVASVVHIPDHESIVEDSWSRPDWAPASPNTLWLPETPWRVYAGALAVCMMRDSRAKILAKAAEWNIPVVDDDGNPTDSQDDADWDNIATKLKSLKDDPFFPVDQLDDLREAMLGCGLPSFPRVFNALIREGRHARCIERIDIPGPVKRVSWAWRWAPGCSHAEPGEGPKIAYVRRWLETHPGEALVVGAGGRATVAAIVAMLGSMNIAHRVIQGGVSAADRATFVTDFQNGVFPVMVVQQVAGSEAITLTRAATSILVDHDLKATAYTQFIHRTWRQGQAQETTHIDLVFGDVQGQVLSTIHRGRSFDQNTRDQLEAEYRQG
jgi:superfamily II DNA or RNA helicase